MSLLALPVSAHAAEGFVGVTERGSVVRFTGDSPYALTKPKRPSGLAPGERIVAVGRGQRGLVAVGSSARLYALDAVTARASAIGPSFPQGLRGSRFSLAAAPNYLRELARGTTTMAESALETPPEFPLGEPLAFSLGDDGKAYVAAVATDRRRDRQSVFLAIDPATGRYAAPRALGFRAFGRRMVTFTSTGSLPEDRTAPKIRVTMPRRLSVRALLAHRFALRVRSSEAGQLTTSLRIAGHTIGFGFATRDTPGVFTVTTFAFTRKERSRLRADMGRRARVVIGVSDLKGNHRRTVRTVRLIR